MTRRFDASAERRMREAIFGPGDIVIGPEYVDYETGEATFGPNAGEHDRREASSGPDVVDHERREAYFLHDPERYPPRYVYECYFGPAFPRPVSPPPFYVFSLSDAMRLNNMSGYLDVTVLSVDSIGIAPAMLEIVEARVREEEGFEFKFTRSQPLRLAARLAGRIDALVNELIPTITANPTNPSNICRLRNTGKAVRHIGLKLTAEGFSFARAIAIKMGNRLKKMARLVLAGRRSPAWLVSRLRDELERLKDAKDITPTLSAEHAFLQSLD